jgi:segregation and condensation protein A
VDTGQSLVRQLEAYRRYRAVAQQLLSWEEGGRRAFFRTVPPDISPSSLPEGAASPMQLLAALADLLARQPSASPVSELISPITISIDDQMSLIRERSRAKGRLTFCDLISPTSSRMEVIVTFLALLELIRLREVVAWQEEIFGEILITHRPPP